MNRASAQSTLGVLAETAARAGRLSAAAVLLSVMIAVFWGTNPTVLKIALRGLPAIGTAGLRFAIAALGVAVWCRATGVATRSQRGEGLWLAVLAGLFTVQIATFTLGVDWGTASHTIVILHTYPFFVVALAHFLIPGDRATPGRVAGLLAAFTGIVVLFAGGWGRWQGRELLGNGIQLFSAFLLAVQIVVTKHAVARVDFNRVVLWEMLVSAPLFLLYSVLFEHLAAARPGPASIAAVVYQGTIIGTLCFTVWTWLLRNYSASRVAIFGFIGPLVGVFLSAAVLGEHLSATLLASAALVGAGIVLGNLW